MRVNHRAEGHPALVLTCLLHRAGLRDERSHGLDEAGEREPVDGGAAARFAQPDRAGGVRCRDQRGGGQSLYYGQVRSWAGADDRGGGVGAVATKSRPSIATKVLKIHPGRPHRLG